MANVVIEVEERDTKGKNVSRRLRRQGMIPAVLYGAGKPVMTVTVDPRKLQVILGSETGENTLLKLRLKGKDAERHAMIKEYQVDPVTEDVIHADFIRIEMDQKLTVSVPVRVQGDPPGVKEQGGLLEVVHRQVDVECLPADIPDYIDVDVSALNIGDHASVDAVEVSDRYRILESADTVLVTVVAPRAVEEEVAEEAAPVAEGETPEAAGEDGEEAKSGDKGGA